MLQHGELLGNHSIVKNETGIFLPLLGFVRTQRRTIALELNSPIESTKNTLRLWSVLGKIKPRNDEKIHKNEWKGLSFGSGSILELERGQNDEMLPRVHPSPSTSGRGLGATTTIKMCQDYRERPC